VSRPAPRRKRSISRQIGDGSSTVRVFPPLPNTVTWPPSVRGCRSGHLRSAISETRRPAMYSNRSRTWFRRWARVQSAAASHSVHQLPRIERSGVVLPEVLLERIERQTTAFRARRPTASVGPLTEARDAASFGPPGVGKTLTVMHLVGRMPGRTVILTTGRGMGMVQAVAQMARTLAQLRA